MSTEISSSFAPLHALLSLVSTSLATIEFTCQELNVSWPSLDDASYMSKTGFRHEDMLRMKNEAIARASAVVVAAASQLISSVREPSMSAVNVAMSHMICSALRAAAELHVADILRDAGTEGLHVDEIARKINIDPVKLARILRLLVTHHYFLELRPDVFANNRLSASLEKGQPIEALIGNPAGKYNHPASTVAALVSHCGDDMYKSSSVLFETLANPATAFSGSPADAPAMRSRELNLNFDSSKTVAATSDDSELGNESPSAWDLQGVPVPPATPFGFETERLVRWEKVRESAGRFIPLDEVLVGFDFNSLPVDARVVDVGGGGGMLVRALVAKYEEKGEGLRAKFVIQDLEDVCKNGEKEWQTTNPQALESGLISFQAQSFFSSQPQANRASPPALYLLKNILHDWSDRHCRKILQLLRDAASTSSGPHGATKLLVFESLVPYACRSAGGASEEAEARRSIPGVYTEPAQEPLLPNWGVAGAFTYFSDIMMLQAFNGQERTLAHMRTLLRSAGWEIVKVTQPKKVGVLFALIEANAV